MEAPAVLRMLAALGDGAVTALFSKEVLAVLRSTCTTARRSIPWPCHLANFEALPPEVDFTADDDAAAEVTYELMMCALQHPTAVEKIRLDHSHGQVNVVSV